MSAMRYNRNVRQDSNPTLSNPFQSVIDIFQRICYICITLFQEFGKIKNESVLAYCPVHSKVVPNLAKNLLYFPKLFKKKLIQKNGTI